MATMRGPNVYDIRNGMNFRDINDVQPIHIRLSPQQSRFDNQDIQFQNGRYDNQNGRYNNRPETPPKKRLSWCTKRCVIGVIIGLTIGLLISAAVVIPVGVIPYQAPLGTISSTPNWIGTYQMDSSCDTSQCCCLINQIFVSEPNTQILISGAVTGICANLPSTVALTAPIPTTSFQVLLSWYGEVLRFQLGQDNNYLSLVNINYPYCSATAVRLSYSHGTRKKIHWDLFLFTLLITFGIIV